jgi:nucleosome binding factor SPN SPT16 subunit
VRTAGAISAAVLKNFVVPEIETIVDEEKKVTHSAVAEKIDDIFLTPSKINPKARSTHFTRHYCGAVCRRPSRRD